MNLEKMHVVLMIGDQAAYCLIVTGLTRSLGEEMQMSRLVSESGFAVLSLLAY